MADNTVNYNLTKPLETEKYDIKVQNDNMDKIDTVIDGLQKEVTAQKNDYTTLEGDYAQHKLDYNEQKFKIKNTVLNGSFEDGLLGWTGTSLTPVIDNQIKSHGQNSIRFNYANETRRIEQEILSNVGDILFLHQKTYIKTPSGYDNSYGRFTESFGNSVPTSPLPNFDITKLNQWQTTTLMFTSTGNNSYRIGRNTADTTDFYVDDIVIINLTQTFGAGFEPTKEEMMALITGYIDGEKIIDEKTMLAWQYKMIRQNRNAIVALGGTIV